LEKEVNFIEISYSQNQIIAIKDESLQKELEIFDKVISAPSRAENLYFEHQEEGTDTCFIHATNMYLQVEYLAVPRFPYFFSKIAAKINDEIQNIIKKNAAFSFYEKGAVTLNKVHDDSSDPMWNEDLKGYYEIYRDLDCVDFSQVNPKNKLWF
jgi:hypothetical protein